MGNIANRTLFIRDNLEVMRGMDSDSVDLIYLDPPFNSKRMYSAPLGSKAEGQAFSDIWKLSDAKEEWVRRMGKYDHTLPVVNVCMTARATHGDPMYGYLVFMARRLIEMKRILKPTGSIFLHCDPTANAYLRLLMNAIFGKAQFRNEIIWCYTGPGSVKRHFKRKHDTILFYANPEAGFNMDAVRVPYAESSVARGSYGGDFGHGNGAGRDTTKGKVPEDWWAGEPGMGAGGAMSPKERTGWKTQKPLALLERIIKAASNKGDLVLDPFAGCCTCAIASEKLERDWIGIDWDKKAAKVVFDRLDRSKDLIGERTVTIRKDIPQRTGADKLPHPRVHRARLYDEQEGRCAGCNKEKDLDDLANDHIEPKAKGGTNEIENLQLLCHRCNSVKGARDMSYLLARLAKRNARLMAVR